MAVLGVEVMMRRAGWLLSAAAAMGLAASAFAQAVRVKDVATVKGVRDNQLYGYGLAQGVGQLYTITIEPK